MGTGTVLEGLPFAGDDLWQAELGLWLVSPPSLLVGPHCILPLEVVCRLSHLPTASTRGPISWSRLFVGGPLGCLPEPQAPLAYTSFLASRTNRRASMIGSSIYV